MGLFSSAQDNLHMRSHRARSIILSPAELIEMRAIQRTFEGAYTRTALSQFSFSLLVLKIFTHEFYSVGALFAVFGTCIYGVSLLRRSEGNKQFFVDTKTNSEGAVEEEERMFRTSGNVVFLVTGMSVAAYVALLVLVLRIG
ncbi:hypothetical protein DFH27DRAFT_617928 [Peziza echinospora]|nr:hypothetical protein DFH27DRAFT_617928 [Peziza echinospora]